MFCLAERETLWVSLLFRFPVSQLCRMPYRWLLPLTVPPAGRSWNNVKILNSETCRWLWGIEIVALRWLIFVRVYQCVSCVSVGTGKKLTAPILLGSGELNGWPGIVHGGNLGLWLAERASLAPRVSWGEIEYISVSLSGCWALASLEPSTQRETLSGGHSSPWIPADVIGTESLLLLWQRWRHQRATLNCNSFIGKQWRSKIKSKKIKAFNVTRTHRLNYLLLQRSAIFIIA